MLFGSNLFSGSRLFVSLLLVFALYGCRPQTQEDCLLEAAKAPTEAGVRQGLYACVNKSNQVASPVEKINTTPHITQQSETPVGVPLTDAEKAEKIIGESVKCDIVKREEYAKYIVTNASKKGSTDFEIVAKEYVKIRDVCEALSAVGNRRSAQPAETD